MGGQQTVETEQHIMLQLCFEYRHHIYMWKTPLNFQYMSGFGITSFWREAAKCNVFYVWFKRALVG